MPVAAVRYASPASVPADLPRYAALCYPTGSVVPGDVKRLECGLYLPGETVPTDRRKVGVVPYLPGASIPADMRRIIPVRSGAVAYVNAVLFDSPVGYWRLGEASGTSAADASGNGRSGTLGAGVAFGASGALAADPDGTQNTAATFAGGVTSYVSVADHASLDLGDTFTLEAWAMRTGGAGTYGILVGKPSGGYEMGFNSSNQMCIFKAGVAEPAHTAATFGADGIWRHYVVTKSGSTRHIYVNGVEDTVLAADATMADTATDLTIGAEGTLNTFIGHIDEVAVYPTVLSPARIAAHYAAGTGR